MKVLVIEDEPQIRDIFAEFVELLGHEAEVAVDGRDGLARFDPLVHKIVIFFIVDLKIFLNTGTTPAPKKEYVNSFDIPGDPFWHACHGHITCTIAGEY